MTRTSTSSFGKFTGYFIICLSVFFAVIGVTVYFVFLPTPEVSGFAWIWLTMSLLCVPCIGLGIHLVRRAVREDRVFSSGLAGQGTIVGMKQTGTGVGTPVYEGGGGITPIFVIDLHITVPGHQPYRATVREIMSPLRQSLIRPGLTVAIRADPAKLSRVVIDWGKGAGSVVAGVAPGAATSGLPTLSLTGAESSEAIRARVREVGVHGLATIDAVTPAGQAGDGRQVYLLGMWVQLDNQAPLRVDAPSAVDEHLRHKVTVGRVVPVRAALAGGAQLTVLCWDEA